MTSSSIVAEQLSDEASPHLLPRPLPLPPLELQVALHQIVLRSMRADLARAQRAAERSRQIADRFPDQPLLDAQAHWSAGTAVLYRPDYARALVHYDAALAAYARAALAPEPPARDVRVVEVVRVFCLNELGRYAEAEAAALAAERWLAAHPSPAVELALRVNQSLLAGNMGDYARMRDVARAVVALADAADSPADRAMGWINNGYAQIALGRLDAAEDALARGLSDARHAEEPLTAARALVNRAWLRRCQGRLAEALADLRAATAGFAQAPGEAATVALETASLYAQLRQHHDALRQARLAAASFRAQHMPLYSASAELEAARICAALSDAPRAARHLAAARTDAASLGLSALADEAAIVAAQLAALPGAARPGLRPALSEALAVAERLAAAGLDHEAAIAQLAAAALSARLGQRAGARAIYAALTGHAWPAVRLDALAGLGTLLPPQTALAHLRAAANLATAIRRTLPAEELQARYASETSSYHLRLAQALIAGGDSQAALGAVWEAKAGSLLDLRAAAGGLEASALTGLAQARADLSRLRGLLREHRGKALEAAQLAQAERAAFHERAAVEAAAAMDEAERELTRLARAHTDRTGRAEPPGVGELQAALSPRMALLEYVLLDDEVVCVVVRPRGAVVVRSLGPAGAIADTLARWDLLRHSSQGAHYAGATAARRRNVLAQLGAALLAPLADLLAEVEQLLIAPAGALHQIPWAALPYADADLVDRFLLALTPSGALWAAPVPAPSEAPGPPRLLGYAGAGDAFLPGVAAELSAVAAELPDAVVVEPAGGADLRRGPPPRLLHIAAHGVTRPDAPMASSIELVDGPFLLLEAHRLNLRGTELVVLSACETGERPGYGEMALAIAGAFLCAGARAVLASLWAIDDRAAAQLMAQFHRELARGVDAALALRSAQLALRAAGSADWAAFQLWLGVGADRSATEKRPMLV